MRVSSLSVVAYSWGFSKPWRCEDKTIALFFMTFLSACAKLWPHTLIVIWIDYSTSSGTRTLTQDALVSFSSDLCLACVILCLNSSSAKRYIRDLPERWMLYEGTVLQSINWVSYLGRSILSIREKPKCSPIAEIVRDIQSSMIYTHIRRIEMPWWLFGSGKYSACSDVVGTYIGNYCGEDWGAKCQKGATCTMDGWVLSSFRLLFLADNNTTEGFARKHLQSESWHAECALPNLPW